MLALTRPLTRGTLGVVTLVLANEIVPVGDPATFSTSERSRVLRERSELVERLRLQ